MIQGSTEFMKLLRDECLNVHCFPMLADTKEGIEVWRKEFNEERPLSSLKNQTPKQFAESFQPAVA